MINKSHLSTGGAIFFSMGWNILQKTHNELVHNTARLLFANIFAQVIGLLVYPVLTRMYAPDDFGLLNLFMSIGGILSLLATSEYQNAVLLPSHENEAAGVARVALCVLSGWLIVIILTIPFSASIAHLLKAPSLSAVYWLLVPYVGLTGCWAVYNAWLTRRREYGRISACQLNQSATGVLTKLLFGWMGWLRSGLVLSSVLSPFIAVLVAVCRSKEAFHGLWQSHDEPIKDIANRYKRFPLYSMPRTLINNLSGNLPALLLTPYFGLNQLGFFAMAMTLAFRPISMITSSVHQVLFEHVAQSVRNHESIVPWLRKQWLRAVAFVIPVMAVITVILPWLVNLFLGDGWEKTATLIRYMMPWMTCVCLVAPLAFISEVFGKQKLFLVLEIVYLVLRVAAMGIGIWVNSFEWAIILMSVAGTVVLLAQLVCYIVILKRYELSRLTQAGE
ncbi:MAG: oligosaccharide flippase family protein [Paludibacteraceae bacterium]|nr:oligosaccharide flippase family protein [Paludibacteraceae bacterium]